MPKLRLQNFAGLIPRQSDRLIPENQAAIAQNGKLTTGESKGFRAPRQVADLTGLSFIPRRAYRIPDGSAYDYSGNLWLAFPDQNVDVVRSPIINDAFDRYYWFGDGRPKYNTLQRIRNGDPPYLLGVPAPTTALNISAPAGSDATRAYVYTFVSAFGEESQPSPPRLETGDPGTWNLAGMETSLPDMAQRNITRKRIYRTVPGFGSSSFFFVAEIPLGQTTYADTEADDVVALNTILPSTLWAPPDPGIEGAVVMPNGYMIAWKGRRLMFSEPYRPHAWPAEYELSTEFEIVGAAVWNDQVVIGTQSNPYIGQGVNPLSFTNRKIDVIEPCVAKRSMVVGSLGVMYASPNGLMLVDASGPRQVTEPIMTAEEWERYASPNMIAAQYGLLYIAFVSPTLGFVFNPTEQVSKFVELDRFPAVVGLETDRYTGKVNLIYQRRVWEWDPPSSERLFWRWRSKEFHFPKPCNFGAVKIKFDTTPADLINDTTDYYLPYNEARFAAAPLSTINGSAICAVQGPELVPDWTEAEIRHPVGGSLLYPINQLLSQISAVRFRAFAGLQQVFDVVVFDEDIIRLPVGFKRDIWQFEMSSNSTVYSVQIAETGRSIEDV